MTGAALSRLVFAATVFVSAFLLFQIQLIVGKLVLPWFGGTPAVWTTCMLVFQSLLVLGYAYAHLVVGKLPPPRQRTVHIAVLALTVIILAAQAIAWGSVVLPPASWKPTGATPPAWAIVQLLAATVASAFVTLSATGPLLQGWFARTHPGVSPYRLYALSNLGSLLGLLTYPVLVEPLLSLRVQAAVWTTAFVAFAALCAWCAFRAARGAGLVEAAADGEGAAGRPGWTLASLWIALAGCASMLLLATTNQISQEVAVVPFLWVLPLCLYLSSLIVCFEWERGYYRGLFMWALAASLAGACVVLHRGLGVRVPAQVLAYSVMLFVACMVCHGELVRLKPRRRHLTAFYLMVSIGGALGGIFVGVIAPLVFSGFWELHLAMALAAMLTVLVLWRDRASWIHRRHPWPAAVAVVGAFALMRYLSGADLLGSEPGRGVTPFEGAVVFAVAAWLVPGWVVSRWRVPGSRIVAMVALSAAVAIFALVLRQQASAAGGHALVRSRTFYGVLAVLEVDVDDPVTHAYRLHHGSITHGVQFQSDERRTLATTYFGDESGVGLAIRHHPRRAAAADRGLRIGVIGLGVGTIATHAGPEDDVRFYEINPAVIALSQGAQPVFTYLADSPARVDVITGDARISLERELEAGAPQRFDVLAIDAFSSDSIPVHLLTREAMAVYLRHLRDRSGIVAVHISNRYLDLRPVVWALADHFGLAAAYVDATGEDDAVWGSSWILLSRDAGVLARPEIAAAAKARNLKKKPRLWTDDYSGLFRVLKW